MLNANKLVAWFIKSQRPLPWRMTYHPYEIWISEVMGQQTRMEVVRHYFQRWMQAFPDVTSLVEADEQRVLKLWEGLGYYSRAKKIHQAAKILHQRYGGELPQRLAELLELPGVGVYTAAAIASIAFDLPVPVVDGNVERLFSRFFAWEEQVKSKASQSFFLAEGQKLVEAASPRLVNQALMELGATLCQPRQAQCDQCPLAEDCASSQEDRWKAYPRLPPRPSIIHQQMLYLVVEKEQKFLVELRQPGQLWAGLWSFPFLELDPALGAKTQVQNWSGAKAQCQPLGKFRYSVTRYQAQAQAWLVRGYQGSLGQKSAWMSLEELQQTSLPKSGVMIRNLLQSQKA